MVWFYEFPKFRGDSIRPDYGITVLQSLVLRALLIFVVIVAPSSLSLVLFCFLCTCSLQFCVNQTAKECLTAEREGLLGMKERERGTVGLAALVRGELGEGGKVK